MLVACLEERSAVGSVAALVCSGLMRPALILGVCVLSCRPAIIFIPSYCGATDHGSHAEERRLTAQVIDCAESAVVIRDHHFGFSRSSWMAECKERRYRCAISFPPAECQATSEPLPARVEHDG
jgi:hypothetical protein